MSTRITVNVNGSRLLKQARENQLANRQTLTQKESDDKFLADVRQIEASAAAQAAARQREGAVPEYRIREQTSAQRGGGGGMFWVYVTHEYPDIQSHAEVEKIRVAVGSTDGTSWAYVDLGLDYFNDPKTRITEILNSQPGEWYFSPTGTIVRPNTIVNGAPSESFPVYNSDRGFADIALPVNDKVCIYVGSIFITAYIKIDNSGFIYDEQVKRINFAFVVSGNKCRKLSVPAALATELQRLYPSPVITRSLVGGNTYIFETQIIQPGIITKTAYPFWDQALDFTSAPFDMLYGTGTTGAKDRDYTPMWSYNFNTSDQPIVYDQYFWSFGKKRFLGYLHTPNAFSGLNDDVQKYYYQGSLSNQVFSSATPANIIVETIRTGSPAIYDLLDADVNLQSDYSVVANRVGFYKADATRASSGWAAGKNIPNKIIRYYEDVGAVDLYTYESPGESPWVESLLTLYDYIYLPASLRSQSKFYELSPDQQALDAIPSGNISFDFTSASGRASAVLSANRVLPPALFNSQETLHPLVSPQLAKLWFSEGNTFYPINNTMYFNNQLYPFAFTGWGQDNRNRLLSLGFTNADLTP